MVFPEIKVCVCYFTFGFKIIMEVKRWGKDTDLEGLVKLSKDIVALDLCDG